MSDTLRINNLFTTAISNVLYTSLADSGQTAASMTTSGMPGTAPSGSVISGTYRLTAGASAGAAVMRLSSFTYTAGTTYNFTFTGMQGSQTLALYVYQYNSAGTDKIQISSDVYTVTTSAATISGSFTANLYPATYTGTIVFYFQALAVNQYVNFTTFSMTSGAMNVGIGTSTPLTKLQITQDGNSVLNETGSHSMGILSNQGTSGTNLMYMMLDADYTNQCCSIQSIVYGLKAWYLNLNPRGGNVGIGTTNPGAVLHIIDPVSSTTSAPLMLFSPNLSTGGSQYIYFGTANSTNNSAQIGWANVSAGSASNYAFLQIYGKANIMTWQASTGNVGIGTASPGYLLTVGAVATPTANSAGTTVIQCNGNLNVYRNRLIFSGTPTDWNHCIYNNNHNLDNEGAWDGMKFNVYNGAWFRVGTAAAAVPTTAMYINASGQVGIGLTNQTHSLQVYGALGLPTITTTGDFPSQLVLHSASAWLKIGHYYTGGVGTYSILQSSDYFSGAEHPCNLLLQPLGGNVGIGITNPSVPLQVNGSIVGSRMYSVSGSLTVSTSAVNVYSLSGSQSGFINVYWGNGSALYFFQWIAGVTSVFINQLTYNASYGSVSVGVAGNGPVYITATANITLTLTYVITFNT